MLDTIKLIRSCVTALKACDEGKVWNEEDKSTFYKMLDKTIEDSNSRS